MCDFDYSVLSEGEFGCQVRFEEGTAPSIQFNMIDWCTPERELKGLKKFGVRMKLLLTKGEWPAHIWQIPIKNG